MAITPKIASASMTAISSQLSPRIFLRNGVTLFRSAGLRNIYRRGRRKTCGHWKKLSYLQAKRLDGVSPYQFVLRKFPGRATLCGAAREPDSADKMPTGPTAKMAVLRPGFIPKNCRAAIFAAV